MFCPSAADWEEGLWQLTFSQLMGLYQQVGVFNVKPVYRDSTVKNAGDPCANLGLTVDLGPESLKSLVETTTHHSYKEKEVPI